MNPGSVSCAILLPGRLFGGHEKMLVEWLSEATARHGLLVRIHSADNDRLIRACEAAGLGRPVVSYPSAGNGLRDFFVTWRLLGRIPRDVPVLFAPGALQVSTSQWMAAFLRRRRVAGYVPMAYGSRLMGFRGGSIRDWIVGRVIRRVDLWITISKPQRDLMIGQWKVEAPVLVVANRLALLGQETSPARGERDGPLRVLFAGRFDAHQKGLDWLCERLRARRDEWRGRLQFTFKGEGGFQAELMRLSSELGPRHVAVSPWGDPGPAMKAADVLLLPSRFEGLPLAALEATHYGLAVVASKDAGVSELVPPSCQFDFGNEQAMWAALHAMHDPLARAAALDYSRVRVQRSLSAAAFPLEIGRIVAALARMSGSPFLRGRWHAGIEIGKA